MAKGVSKILAKSIKHRSRLPTTEAVRVNDADDNTDYFEKETGDLPEAIPDVSSVWPSVGAIVGALPTVMSKLSPSWTARPDTS